MIKLCLDSHAIKTHFRLKASESITYKNKKNKLTSEL